jgi:hypothetical protein
MAQLITWLIVCHGVLVPRWHPTPATSLSCPARATLSIWFNVLEVRQFGIIPFRLSARSQGVIRIAPVIIRVPEGFSRRFRTKSARESRMHTGTTLAVCGNRLRSSMRLEGKGSEERTTHHSHSTSICSIDFRTFCAALTTRHRDSTVRGLSNEGVCSCLYVAAPKLNLQCLRLNA